MTPGRPVRLIGKLSRLTPRRTSLLAEALALLTFSSVVIALVPFRHVGRLASWPTRHRAPGDAARLIAEVAWAVEACARRLPWSAVCYQQGLSAQLMLRRRGVASTLYFGAAPDKESGLKAHVWVRAGQSDVVGCELADRFAVLSAFPAEGPAPIPAAQR